MLDPSFFWAIFGLVIFALIISCMVLLCLPVCIERSEKEEYSHLTKNQVDYDVTFGKHLGNAQNPFEVKNGMIIRKTLTQKNKPMTQLSTHNNRGPDTMDDLKKIKSYVTRIKGVLLVAFIFRSILDLIFLLVTLSYPPTLWIVWVFFPQNSVVILGIGVMVFKAIISLLICYGVMVICDKWKHFFEIEVLSHRSLNELSTYNFKMELRQFITLPILLCLFFYIYILLRMWLMWLESSAVLVDGWIILTVFILIDFLYIAFPFTLL
jgi:hypothetical protein